MSKVCYLTRILTSIDKKYIINKTLRRQCSIFKREDNKNIKIQIPRTVLEEIDFESEINELKITERESILQPLSEDISHIGPYVKPTFNFAAYVNKSETLQKLVDLGVDLHKIEKKKNAPELILKLDFEKDIKPHIFFLHDCGISEELGYFITTNPYIFQEDLETLTIRINYLQSKQFKKPMITRILTKNPYWLMFSTKRIDSRLGHFQKTFSLTGSEVRKVTTKQPKLITYNMEHIKLNTFSIKEEMGFEEKDMKKLLLDIPKLWMMSQKSILDRFNYIHNTMKISHEQMLHMPKVFTSRTFRIQYRHQFLEKLGRAQYDPKQEHYVSLEQLIEGTDVIFCANIAKSSVQTYNTFLKSL